MAGYYSDRVADLTHPILPTTRRSAITGLLITDAVYGNSLYLHITVIGSGSYRGAVIRVDGEVVGVTRHASETLKAAVGAAQGDTVTVTATPGNEFGTFGGSYTTTHEILSDTSAADGLGIESVYAVSNSATVQSTQRPSNDWGFDEPTTIGGLQWHDAPPAVSEATPYLWRSQRRVSGVPSIGASVADDWTSPNIFGRYGADGTLGVEGADGEDGNGVEYVFTVTSGATLVSSRRPSNSWGYDQPGTNGGQTWDDGAPNVTESNPILWRSTRRVPGDPTAGTAVSDTWSEPRIVGRFGADGQRGIQGIEGADAEDGNGVEYVFTVTSGATLASSRRPANSWGYDQPGTNGGQTWDDGAPNVTESNPILWRSTRRVPGDPTAGTAVSDTWSEPRIVGRFGADGQRGIQGIEGADAEDGNGVEYVFTVTSGATLASSRRPANSWGYDQPGTNGGQTWDDGAPNVTESNPILWRSTRRVPGDPTAGTAVSDDWSEPRIVGRFGADGQQGIQGIQGIEGADAEDGNGVEYVFTVTSGATLVSSRRPANSWGYDQPGTNGGQTWDDGAPNVTESNPILWRSTRRVPGDPTAGTAVSDTWSEPRIVGRFGADGQRGIQGIEGADAEDGNGVEYVFTVTSGATLASSRRPANSWGYDSPATAGGQQWDDGAPNVTESNPILWRSTRRVPGDPNVGTAVSDTWSEPRIVGRFGADGQRGIQGIEGADAEDGNGVEYVFTVTSGATLASSRRPANSWGYDQPGTNGGQTWDDGAPNTSVSSPNLWRSQRRVPGDPTAGTAVSDDWSTPVIVSRYGEDGIAGIDGDDAPNPVYVASPNESLYLWISSDGGSIWQPAGTSQNVAFRFRQLASNNATIITVGGRGVRGTRAANGNITLSDSGGIVQSAQDACTVSYSGNGTKRAVATVTYTANGQAVAYTWQSISFNA